MISNASANEAPSTLHKFVIAVAIVGLTRCTKRNLSAVAGFPIDNPHLQLNDGVLIESLVRVQLKINKVIDEPIRFYIWSSS